MTKYSIFWNKPYFNLITHLQKHWKNWNIFWQKHWLPYPPLFPLTIDPKPFAPSRNHDRAFVSNTQHGFRGFVHGYVQHAQQRAHVPQQAQHTETALSLRHRAWNVPENVLRIQAAPQNRWNRQACLWCQPNRFQHRSRTPLRITTTNTNRAGYIMQRDVIQGIHLQHQADQDYGHAAWTRWLCLSLQHMWRFVRHRTHAPHVHQLTQTRQNKDTLCALV